MSNDTECVTVLLVDDSLLENDEQFLLQPSNNSLVMTTGSPVLITIQDNDCMEELI